MKIIICGDLVPTANNMGKFTTGDVRSLIGDELISLFSNADLRIFNLETPLTDILKPIEKTGPNLIAPVNSIKGIKAIGFDLACLSNNHILDQGVQGIKSTIRTLHAKKIHYVGAGNNIEEAKKPYIYESAGGGLRLGVYACCEHEFSIAGKDSPGANPFDPLESLDHIKELQSQCDYLIVLFHSGLEHYRYPTPYQQKVCRKMIEKGAGLVVCQHSHCVGCQEKYLGGTIIYGQGNFIFDNHRNEYWDTGLAIALDIEGDKPKITYHPLGRANGHVRLAIGDQANAILKGFYKRSDEITEIDFVYKRIKTEADRRIANYLIALKGSRYYLWVLKKIFGDKLLNQLYNMKQLNSIQNIIRCESHREIILVALESSWKDLNMG